MSTAIPSINAPSYSCIENVQPIQPLHPGQSAKVADKALPIGHSAMSGKALLAKKAAASGNNAFYSPTDSYMSPCTAKLHLAKKKNFAKGKPLALSSSFITSNNNPLAPSSQHVPLTNVGFLHPSHAKQAQSKLATQGVNDAASDAGDDDNKSEAAEEDEEMEVEM